MIKAGSASQRCVPAQPSPATAASFLCLKAETIVFVPWATVDPADECFTCRIDDRRGTIFGDA